MISVKIEDNMIPKIKEERDAAKRRAHEQIGIAAEKYAKALCPVGTVESTGKKGYRGGTLRRSIAHRSDADGATIGTNVVYGPFVELGTGPYFEPPPEWETFEQYTGSGGGHGYVRPRPFLRPAIVDHLELYKRIYEDEFTGGGLDV